MTFGCQMNEADSEQAAGYLRRAGYEICAAPEEADLLLVNTCVVRDKAEQKAIGRMGRFRDWKEAKANRLLILLGCLVSKEERVLRERFPFVDLMLDPMHLDQFPRALAEVTGRDDLAVAVRGAAPAYKNPVRAFINVILGCNYGCTFCIVPKVRGPERSLSVREIVSRVRDLAEQGYKEVVLLGQNVLSYGRDWNYARKQEEGVARRHPFSALLERVHEVEGIERIRFVTSHPLDCKEELLETCGRLPKVMPYFHLPVQSGDDDVLRAMRRGYTRDDYLRLAETIRSRFPGAALSTDLIVAFPGETTGQFENTLSLCRRVRFDHAYTFAYSVRSGTPAARMPNQVPEAEKKRRLSLLNECVDAIAKELNERLVGTLQEVLIEEAGPDAALGRAPTNRLVSLSGSPLPVGAIVTARITAAKNFRLEGVPADTPPFWAEGRSQTTPPPLLGGSH